MPEGNSSSTITADAPVPKVNAGLSSLAVLAKVLPGDPLPLPEQDRYQDREAVRDC